MISTAVYLYEHEDEFRDKLRAQPYFCINHYTMLISYAQKKMNKKKKSTGSDLESDQRKKQRDEFLDDYQKHLLGG